MTTTIGSSTAIIFQRSFFGVLRKNVKLASTSSVERKFEEIKFTVPWGHVSGKWYGPKNTRPIVGLHGWQDNAGTFDTLAPLLPPHIGFLSIDLPGHGLSSWLPNGCAYHSIDYVKFIFTLMSNFNWSKISLISHSMSSANGFIFCSLFPDKCDMFVGLDILKPSVTPDEKLVNKLVQQIETHHRLNEINNRKSEPPCYDYDELVERLYSATRKSIHKESCKYILERNIKPSLSEQNKYYFSRDVRLKSMMFHTFSNDVIVAMAKRISCPYLFLKVKNSPKYEKKEFYDGVIEILLRKPNFEYHQVDGTHHVHLNEPKKVADIINPFINKHKTE